jgi:DNA repair protein RadA/Sms
VAFDVTLAPVQGQRTAGAEIQRAAEPSPTPPRARAYCLDCAKEIDEDDAEHLNHARSTASVGRESEGSRIQSVALDLLSGVVGYHRISTGIPGLDRVLGGGLVRNGIVVIDGPPGIGKSTLLASAAGRIASRGDNVLYVSGEETAEQVAACAWRIGHAVEGVRVLSTQSLDDALREVRLLEEAGWRCDVLIVDSAQAMRVSSISSPTGSTWMVGAVGNELRAHAKANRRSVVLVSQVVKDGTMAGPKSLEHAVDAVLDFGRDETDSRFLRTKKNRFGPVGEVTQFEMGARGLVEVEDPSLVSWRDIVGDPGVSACVCAHLAKPVLVPVEALVSPDDAGSGARSIQATGVAVDRVRFVLEAMTRHSGVSFSKVTVRVRVPQVAGEDVSDSALDLAIGAACWSSLTNTSLGGLVLWGAIGLSGKIQSVGRIDSRVEYAERVRASSIVAGHPKSKTPAARLPVLAVSHVADLVGAIDLMRGRSEHDRQEEARREQVRSEAARREEAPDASPF